MPKKKGGGRTRPKDIPPKAPPPPPPDPPDPDDPDPFELPDFPEFDPPQVLDGPLPRDPACGSVLALAYNDLAETSGGHTPGAIKLLREAHGERLLRYAREQARRYCWDLAPDECGGVEELDHHVDVSFVTRADADGTNVKEYGNVALLYLFRCTEPTPDPEPDWKEMGWPRTPFVWKRGQFLICDSDYQLTLSTVAEIVDPCDSPDVAVIKQRNEQRLLDRARELALEMCKEAGGVGCGWMEPKGYGVTHVCFRSAKLGASYLLSTIAYIYQCQDVV